MESGWARVRLGARQDNLLEQVRKQADKLKIPKEEMEQPYEELKENYSIRKTEC